MTDPDFAHATYIEPITPEVVAKIIEREKPDAVLPTLGGQTGLNTAMALFEMGLIGVPGTPEMIGANAEAIATAEDREKFKQAMIEIGLAVPSSGSAHTLDEAMEVVERIGLPIIIRPAYILGGRGTGIASTMAEFEVRAAEGLAASPISEILIEKSIAGWKEYELEVMRDRADNCVIICSIENVDPMGVHTGDSITVAPAQTLSDVEYQQMRDAAFACIRRVGVETGGSNVQFAVNPATGEQVVIEMNPRVSRSSALASKATGFPIAKIAAKLAVGYTLDEITNDITHADAGVVRAKHRLRRHQDPALGVREAARFVGRSRHADAIGRRGDGDRSHLPREPAEGRCVRWSRAASDWVATQPKTQLATLSDKALLAAIAIPTPDRIFQVGELLRRGVAVEAIHEACRIDRVVPRPDAADHRGAAALADAGHGCVDVARTGDGPSSSGSAMPNLAYLWDDERTRRARRSVKAPVSSPTYKTVDTCAAEFAAETPYHYSTWEDENEVRPSDRPRVVILGSGPNRIGQGIEFDYCCVHASFALRDAGLRDGDGQLQPGDGQHRLRHQRPLVLRAADARGRAQRDRRRDRWPAAATPPKVIVSLGRADPAEAVRRTARVS